MKCVICKTGTTKQGKVTVTFDIKGTVVVIRNVPAKVCSNCGNYYLSSKTSKLIMEKVQQAVKKGVEIEVMRLNAA
ncbi:MAG: type II toxin-antitoxin system MqsA family antitoxin [Bacteroidetes bacterium]|nr:MAG: type II toxin-antitoxin system MqsA family antitoxin [Bacteroidota bacterium]